jgi:threonine 3-dehydrogenase
MSGNPTAFRDLLRTMHHGGSIAMLGIPPTEVAIDWNQVIFKGLVIKGIYGREMFETWYKMAAMLQAASTSRDITHRLPIAEFRDGLNHAQRQSGKVI